MSDEANSSANPLQQFRLDGKIALITGGSRGLGRAMSFALAKAGANVVIVSRKFDACDQVANEIRLDTGLEAIPYSCDVGRWNQLEPLVEDVYERCGRVDVLINNAGMSPLYESLTDVSEEMIDKVLNVNLKGPLRLSALVGSRMVQNGGGSIVNISSHAAVASRPPIIPYAAAKAGLNSITVGLARTYAPSVRVNCIMAGAFFTDVSRSWDIPAYQARAEREFFLQRIGDPQEIVGAALYFASDASSFTTGSVLSVDGGR